MSDWKSEQIADLCAALSAAQGAMGAATKDSTATVRGKSKSGADVEYSYKYATLADCWEIARPALAANGLSFTQLPFSTESGCLALRSLLVHSSGQWLKNERILPVVESEKANPHQAEAAAVTYAKRMDLCAMLGIPSEDDDGASASNIGDKRTTAAAAAPGTVPIGKHKGAPWADIPIPYLEWASGTDNPLMRDGARAELERRSAPKHSDGDPPIPKELG